MEKPRRQNLVFLTRFLLSKKRRRPRARQRARFDELFPFVYLNVVVDVLVDVVVIGLWLGPSHAGSSRLSLLTYPTVE